MNGLYVEFKFKVPGADERAVVGVQIDRDANGQAEKHPAVWVNGYRLPERDVTLIDDTEVVAVADLPYPWCVGAPTQDACRQAGTCRRNPNCGE